MSLLGLYISGAACYAGYCLLMMDTARLRHDTARGREIKHSARKVIDENANRLALTPIWPYVVLESVYRLVKWR